MEGASGRRRPALDLTLSQPDRPPMRVGGEEDRPAPARGHVLPVADGCATGTLTVGGKAEKVTGEELAGPAVGHVLGGRGQAAGTGSACRLADGSDLIVYRVKDNQTSKVLRAEALLDKDGKQVVDKAPTFAAGGTWTDPATEDHLPADLEGHPSRPRPPLTVTPAFPDQSIPWSVSAAPSGGRRQRCRHHPQQRGPRRARRCTWAQ